MPRLIILLIVLQTALVALADDPDQRKQVATRNFCLELQECIAVCDSPESHALDFTLTVRTPGHRGTFNLVPGAASFKGMSCGGSLSCYAQPVPPYPTLKWELFAMYKQHLDGLSGTDISVFAMSECCVIEEVQWFETQLYAGDELVRKGSWIQAVCHPYTGSDASLGRCSAIFPDRELNIGGSCGFRLGRRHGRSTAATGCTRRTSDDALCSKVRRRDIDIEPRALYSLPFFAHSQQILPSALPLHIRHQMRPRSLAALGLTLCTVVQSVIGDPVKTRLYCPQLAACELVCQVPSVEEKAKISFTLETSAIPSKISMTLSETRHIDMMHCDEDVYCSAYPDPNVAPEERQWIMELGIPKQTTTRVMGPWQLQEMVKGCCQVQHVYKMTSKLMRAAPAEVTGHEYILRCHPRGTDADVPNPKLCSETFSAINDRQITCQQRAGSCLVVWGKTMPGVKCQE
ncbi:hypothetical protein E5Q_05352 [Mixia osmundae IAM 14324]|uniref:Uncharacterized protein n=1 Tax=Mixia osmundae (strain CBS 9802 / IAM 14324 / JCM 22182 / KY 12970) TaxID=764103 RepID=G7E754_MIXOS|nr:hypothetical protein E5Q_05352 [Mixia osmundae IAM 14324]